MALYLVVTAPTFLTYRMTSLPSAIAMSDVFTSAFEITEKVLAENVDQKPTLTVSAHPDDSRDQDFDLAQDFIPDGFYLIVDDPCHLLFTTNKMINILSQAKHWFIDATFKLIKKPFTQVLSIHAIIKCDDCLKQATESFL